MKSVKKAKIIALEISEDRDAEALRQRENMVYRLFESIVARHPELKKLTKELTSMETDDRQKRRAMIDPFIDRSAVKVVDLDDDQLSELVIYFNCMPNTQTGCEVYVFHQQGEDWDCIGHFPSRSFPEVLPGTRENGYAVLAALRMSERGQLVRSQYLYQGGRYILDERHLLAEEIGDVVLTY